MLISEFYAHPFRTKWQNDNEGKHSATQKGADVAFNYNLELESIISYSQNLINTIKNW